ncbi:MAG: DOMON-like domain-containing protein [Proteobacteria bacterium]|nr:DOMON-like domain-containing protein [Pseudomonadota bacterium]
MAARITGLDANWLTLRWRIEGAGGIVVPQPAGRRRADGLWRTTCFELFAMAGGGGYAEFNLSPSENWAAYDFSGYRAGMAERAVPRAPACAWRGGGDLAIFDAAIPRAALPMLPASIGLSAVIEETGGRISYWALAHAPGKADFHASACFAAMLEAPPPA